MASQVFSDAELRALFKSEYERLNREKYDLQLPAFPGVEITRAHRQLGACATKHVLKERVLGGFRLTRWFKDHDALLDTIRHEIAHAAAWIIDGERGHGSTWQYRATECGAMPLRSGKKDDVLVKRPSRTIAAIVECPNGCYRRTFFRECRTTRNAEAFKCHTCGERVRAVRMDRPEPARKPDVLADLTSVPLE